jgi:hypothetical protein
MMPTDVDCPQAALQTATDVKCRLFSDGKWRTKSESCEKCQTEWTSGPPSVQSPKTWTPTLVQINEGKIPPKPPTISPRITLETEHKEPGLFEKAKNLGTAIIKYALSGFKNVSDEDYAKRKEICGGCEYYRAENDKCSSCGCVVSLKIAMASESCPVNKWQSTLAIKQDGGCGCNNG